MDEVMNEEVAVAKLNQEIKMAKAMKRLQDNEDFQLVFDEHFIKDWALTQTFNVSTYQPQSRIIVMENMLARSIFSQFCDDLITDGQNASESLRQIEEEKESTVE